MAEQPDHSTPAAARKKRSPAAVAAENAPWLPTQWDPADVLSLQRCYSGTANALEQKRALEWILKCTGINDEPYRPGRNGDTEYALGKQAVGRQIVKLLKLNLARLKGGGSEQA